jgi:hypothetical protein
MIMSLGTCVHWTAPMLHSPAEVVFTPQLPTYWRVFEYLGTYICMYMLLIGGPEPQTEGAWG